MRRLFPVILLLAASAWARAAEVELVRVWPGWREAASFERISEFFGGDEDHGREVVLRTRPASREGFYFLVRTRSGASLAGARFEVAVIGPDRPEPREHAFPAVVPAGGQVFQLGITGGDWPAGRERGPVAWKVTLRAADGRVLAEQKSFLWEKPAK